METNGAHQHNWVLGAAASVPPTATSTVSPIAAPPTPSAAPSVLSSLSVGSLTIANSQLTMIGIDGKVAVYDVSKMSLDMQGNGAVLDFDGSVAGTAVTAKIKTGITDLLSKAAFPFDADVTYGRIQVSAQGNADLEHSSADIKNYQVVAGNTTLKGTASVSWAGMHPLLRGKLQSDHLDMADFKTEPGSVTNNEAPKEETKKAPAPNGRMFSDTPLPLNGLMAVDVDFDVSVAEFVMGHSALKNVTAKLSLMNGSLVLDPIKASIGSKAIDAQVKLMAQPPSAHLTLGLIADGVDLSELQKLGGMTPFMTGSASANIQLAGTGNSAHAIASSIAGVITITAEKGEILGGAAAGVSSALAAIFSPKGGDSAINCLAVRFTGHYGMLGDNGILIDSASSTVAGKGSISLTNETISLTLHAKTKLVDIGDLVPALAIGGSLSNPTYSVDAVGAVQNVLGNLVNGNLAVGTSSVPTLQTAPGGQNACVFTLDHPLASSTGAPAGVLPSDAVGKASQKIQNIGNSVLKGLFGQ